MKARAAVSEFSDRAALGDLLWGAFSEPCWLGAAFGMLALCWVSPCVGSCCQQEVAHCSCVLDLLWGVSLQHDAGCEELFVSTLCCWARRKWVLSSCNGAQHCFLGGKGGQLLRSAAGWDAPADKHLGVLEPRLPLSGICSPSEWRLEKS